MHPNLGLLIARIKEDRSLQAEICLAKDYKELNRKIRGMGYVFPDEELRLFIDKTCWYAPQWQ